MVNANSFFSALTTKPLLINVFIMFTLRGWCSSFCRFRLVEPYSAHYGVDRHLLRTAQQAVVSRSARRNQVCSDCEIAENPTCSFSSGLTPDRICGDCCKYGTRAFVENEISRVCCDQFACSVFTDPKRDACGGGSVR
jgi:hypothetical protein